MKLNAWVNFRKNEDFKLSSLWLEAASNRPYHGYVAFANSLFAYSAFIQLTSEKHLVNIFFTEYLAVWLAQIAINDSLLKGMLH